MAYFSTVFKMELTVAAQVSKADEDHRCSFPGAQFSVQPSASLAEGWAAGIRAQVPAELGLWGHMWGGAAVGDGTRVPEGLGSREEGSGGCATLWLLSEILRCHLCPRLHLVHTWPANAQGLPIPTDCAHIWVLGEVSAHAISLGPQLISGMGPSTKGLICQHLSLGPHSGSHPPPQLQSPHSYAYQVLIKSTKLACQEGPHPALPSALNPTCPTRTGPEKSSQTCSLPDDRPKRRTPQPCHQSPSSSHVGERQRTDGWGALAGTPLCITPVDLYMTPLIL